MLVSIVATNLPSASANEFVVDDQMVSNPAISLVDPEYNQRNLSLVWSDAIGNLWQAPEFQEYIFFANINTQALGVYRYIDGEWTLFYKIQIPTDLPYLQFPRLLVYQGRSYVALVAAEKRVNGPGGQWLGLPGGECEIWLVGVNPDQPLMYRVSDDTEVSVRTDPEFVVLDNGPVIYYSQWNKDLGTFVLCRARTGL